MFVCDQVVTLGMRSDQIWNKACIVQSLPIMVIVEAKQKQKTKQQSVSSST